MGKRGLMFNNEGYSDPTAGKAFTDIAKDERYERQREQRGVKGLKGAAGSLPPYYLMRIANSACEALGTEWFSADDIERLYERGNAAGPFVRSSDKGLVWVDRWYVAVEPALQETRYLYVTKHHIRDEEETFARIAKSRKENAVMPEGVVRQFDVAKRAMEAGHRQYYIFRYAECFCRRWVRDWRKHLMEDVEHFRKAGACE